ncbi:sodium ion-translocating decarboxylase subunit beta [Actomonas aquatica]|uniref:Sodium ion-translocating decarboxylase subunit beta n=1 Tax=Actomonas aquatica TaxID=2866162 RepID=A0ABZ1C9U9_9BACT|nr:sodium ion-translocating decarboxylase subunit beta [Opitutus sp. WL0086]WRQ88072.1 sodium ion-translocating decarboxylase subunit beta [Opitutus sp. WL0086]
MLQNLIDFFSTTGFSQVSVGMLIMWGIAAVLLYLAVAKGFEPLLLVPIAFGAVLANLPTRGMIDPVDPATFRLEARVEQHGEAVAGEPAADGTVTQTLHVTKMEGGLYDFISQGIKLELIPPLIFLGVGALTDFGPLIAMPRTLLLGAAAQAGVFLTFFSSFLLGFSPAQAASIGIIGGADGPTAIFLSNKLAPELLGAIAVAAYSYMSLVPLIQPPIMRLLTTEKERKIRMKSLRKVSKLEKLVFAMGVMVICVLLVPDATALIGMLMLGNFLRESGVTERLVKAAQNEIINVLTIFLGTSVGITMRADSFLAPATLKIIVLGVIAFCVSTATGVLMAKLMNMVSKTPINPLIGSAGVSAVPMAARVSHVEGQRADPGNYLMMHAMGPNVAGVIGTAVAAGFLISTLSGS